MGTNNQLSPEYICSILKEQQENIEQQMVNQFGLCLYKNNDGFTQEDIYNLCGRNDYVATLTIRNDSESDAIYGKEATVVFDYTKKERLMLEKDPASMNGVSKVRAKALLSICDEDKVQMLATDGINTRDVVEMIVAPSTPKENLFYSKENRAPQVLKVPFEAEGNGKDIYWIYNAYKHCIADGIALSPEEISEYLAYKIILEPTQLTEQEKRQVFNENGQIKNNEVGLKYLIWKEEANRLSERDKKYLSQLKNLRQIERFAKLDKALHGVGGLLKFHEKFPDKAILITKKVLGFHEYRFNVVGKHLMYMDSDSFIHIYLRHVEELKNNQLFGEKTKFQLKEEDVMITIEHVLHDLNDDYQQFKDEHPEWEYRKYSDQAYYYNGDYYAIRIDTYGRLITFYKLDE